MRLLRTASLRVLDEGDLDEALALLDRDPIANVFVSSRLHTIGMDTTRLGAEVWGYGPRGQLLSLCYAGANLAPAEATPEAVRAFADRARSRGRRCSSIVGPAATVAQLWSLLGPDWGPARAIRPRQPVMATSAAPSVEPDPAVRRVRLDEFDIIAPACVAMFTEEVGVSPEAGDGGALYRSRVLELVSAGRAFARIEGGRVVFKAEIGAVTPQACQVQGVWVPPDLRGRGISVHGMASVVHEALRSVAPMVTLYVNDYNVAARRAYRRVGFADVDTFMSVLF